MKKLHRACAAGNADYVRELVELGGDPNAATDDGATPLLLAASKGHLQVSRVLVELGANVHAKHAKKFIDATCHCKSDLGFLRNRTGSHRVESQVGGNGAERRPPPGIQAQHPAPAPHASHARHDGSMARSISVARANLGGLHSSPNVSRKFAPSCERVVGVILFI